MMSTMTLSPHQAAREIVRRLGIAEDVRQGGAFVAYEHAWAAAEAVRVVFAAREYDPEHLELCGILNRLTDTLTDLDN